MKKVVVIIAVIVVILIVAYIFKQINSNLQTSSLTEENKEKVEEISENKIDTTVSDIKEITIYDIEEGYLIVKYNDKADKHEYNFDKYLDTTSYYKYEDDKYTSVLGIDVSEHQENIDWKKVKEAGVEFAILRLGYRGYGQAGRLVLDEKFEEHYRNAIDNGIKVGVYFFSQAINIDEAMEEAEFVLGNIEGKEIAYPIAFDLEKIKFDTARTDNLTQDEITDMAMEFCRIIKESGYTPSIYGNSKTFTTKMKLELFNAYNKWYADYQQKPLYPYEFNMWQYTENGSVDGIEGIVDLDICFVKK